MTGVQFLGNQRQVSGSNASDRLVKVRGSHFKTRSTCSFEAREKARGHLGSQTELLSVADKTAMTSTMQCQWKESQKHYAFILGSHSSTNSN